MGKGVGDSVCSSALRALPSYGICKRILLKTGIFPGVFFRFFQKSTVR